MLPTSRNLLTRPRASSETTDSFFLGFSSKYKHTRLFFFKFLWQQLNNHQTLEEISFLIILSLCKGKLLTDLTRDLHKQQYEQHKNVARICLLYLGQIRKPKRFKTKLGLSWNSAENASDPIFDWSSLSFDRSIQAEKLKWFLHQLIPTLHKWTNFEQV